MDRWKNKLMEKWAQDYYTHKKISANINTVMFMSNRQKQDEPKQQNLIGELYFL